MLLLESRFFFLPRIDTPICPHFFFLSILDGLVEGGVASQNYSPFITGSDIAMGKEPVLQGQRQVLLE